MAPARWRSPRTGKVLGRAQQRRYESFGVTRRAYESGTADLRLARGRHLHELVPPGAAPTELSNRVARGEATLEEIRELGRKFPKRLWPTWVPRTIKTSASAPATPVMTDVAAALSQLPDPSKWRGVIVTPRANDEAWTVTVELKRGYDRVVVIPGGGGDGTGAKQALAIFTKLENEQLLESAQSRKRREVEAIFLEVTGSD